VVFTVPALVALTMIAAPVPVHSTRTSLATLPTVLKLSVVPEAPLKSPEETGTVSRHFPKSVTTWLPVKLALSKRPDGVAVTFHWVAVTVRLPVMFIRDPVLLNVTEFNVRSASNVST
jgi:hypothetical protein